MSPTTIRCMLRTASDPEVGFCLAVSPGISSSDTRADRADRDAVGGEQRVLGADRVTNAGKLVIAPQLKTTSGGDRLVRWPAVFSVGTQQDEQLLHRLDHAAVVLGGGVEEHLQGQLAGLGPVELRRPGLLRAGGRLRCSHFAVLAIVTSLGLNWKSMVPISPSSLRPPVDRRGVVQLSAGARSTCGRPLSPVGDGGAEHYRRRRDQPDVSADC